MPKSEQEPGSSLDLFTRLFMALGLDEQMAYVEGEKENLAMLHDAIDYICDQLLDEVNADDIRHQAVTLSDEDALVGLMADKFETGQIQEGVAKALAMHVGAWKEKSSELAADQQQAIQNVFSEISQLENDQHE